MLPLLNIRFTRVDQHVAVVRAVRQVGVHKWKLDLIDSNAPSSNFKEIDIIDTGKAFKMCYGWETIDNVDHCDALDFESIESAVLVEENERPMINDALVRYYRKQCG